MTIDKQNEINAAMQDASSHKKPKNFSELSEDKTMKIIRCSCCNRSYKLTQSQSKQQLQPTCKDCLTKQLITRT